MKLLFIMGSGRKKGNTDQFCGLIKNHLEGFAAQEGETLQIETVTLADYQIAACRGCRICFDRGEAKCPSKDDLQEIKAKMVGSDGFLVASPVYVNDVSGTMKTFIDRLAYICHRPEFAGKSACLVATTGSSPVGHTLNTLATAFSTWGCHITGQVGIKAGEWMAVDQMKTRYELKAEQAARRFFYAVHRQQALAPSFRSLMTFKIQQHFWQNQGGDSFDLHYWQAKGWTDQHCEFYIPHRANRSKVILARWAGAALARFVA